MMSASCQGVLIENLNACMQQRVATSPTTIGPPYNVDLLMVEGRTAILLIDIATYNVQ